MGLFRVCVRKTVPLHFRLLCRQSIAVLANIDSYLEGIFSGEASNSPDPSTRKISVFISREIRHLPIVKSPQINHTKSADEDRERRICIVF